MKLGLLSFHDAANYGAVLQAYALQAFLRGEGYDAEWLDYRSDWRRGMYDMPGHVAGNLRRGRFAEALKYAAGAPFMALRKRRFAAFRRRHLRVGARELRTGEDLRAVAASGEYARFVVGSDQVWNPFNNGGDAAFLLDFENDPRRKTAYAASFGAAEIPAGLRGAYERGLRGIGRLSVRERAGAERVRELCGRGDAAVVADPVFLLDRGRWDALAGEGGTPERPFVFAYTNRPGQLEAFFRATRFPMRGRILAKLGRQTSPADFLRPGVRVAYCDSPERFLRRVRGADFVLTASFHGLAFAILFKRPFVWFPTGDSGSDERSAGLLAELGLEGRAFGPGMTLSGVEAPVDWDAAGARLGALAARSKAWLLDALGEDAP